MKSLPQGLRGTNGMFALLRNAMAAEALTAALDCGLFTFLAKPRTARETAEALRLHPRTTRDFLTLLAQCGFLREQGETYENTEETTDLLHEASYANVVPLVREMTNHLLRPLRGIQTILREGPVAPPGGGMPEDGQESGPDGSACWAFRGVAQEAASALAALPGAGRFRRMLDLGGGHGVFSLYAAEALPELAVDVYDLPAALRGAEKHIAEWGFGSRVRTVPGDYVREALPAGYDVVFASCTLNFTLPGGYTRQVMDKVHASLVPDGFCVSLHDAPPVAGTGASYLSGDGGLIAYPVECTVFGLLSGMRMAMPKAFIAETMLQSGFVFVHSREFRTSGGTFRLDIAQKGG